MSNKDYSYCFECAALFISLIKYETILSRCEIAYRMSSKATRCSDVDRLCISAGVSNTATASIGRSCPAYSLAVWSTSDPVDVSAARNIRATQVEMTE